MILPETINRICIDDYAYDLPVERIAKFPVSNRDSSKLLTYKNGQIGADTFNNLDRYLQGNSLLVLNNTRVVHARLFFRKPTGALIEIFCLEPAQEDLEMQLAFQQKGSVSWKCLLGNARRWKSGELQESFNNENKTITLRSLKIGRVDDAFEIKFSWEPEELSFAEVLEAAGKIPLPPYLNRGAVDSDYEQYQTVFALHEGSVAAPTAGLHFTPRLLERLNQRSIFTDYLTLHVGAGTFKPVGREGLKAHNMHIEQISISRHLIENLLKHSGNVIAVGTTSVRALESLYWYGVKLEYNKDAVFKTEQFDPYLLDQPKLTLNQAFQNVLKRMHQSASDILTGSTQLMIVPGYDYKVINGMITNFHQPRSTLLLLIAAWLGDKWKEIYDFALKNNFRFLSYGDACLFLK
ncbi:MAG TPA: S-adenosylmethionine:tRNA ribosyltransferase-isomerase [Bacteroidales bacterium]|nr:S-adenosylmethionine:tRNA ribosyltransferase-isomerase [Bacteroidales bacterium]HPR58863.1 S-adenosylmethionine:tRNA ribosyltransferase-isomerase [Bacteroidales bacterium]HRW96584.1 S-adenosylmethionine:tRNA ribosyltransferase-isomerase [Bacteroidales bacterium]